MRFLFLGTNTYVNNLVDESYIFMDGCQKKISWVAHSTSLIFLDTNIKFITNKAQKIIRIVDDMRRINLGENTAKIIFYLKRCNKGDVYLLLNIT